jgi:hypothetical protein
MNVMHEIVTSICTCKVHDPNLGNGTDWPRSSGLWHRWNVGTLPQHYMTSQPRRPRLENITAVKPSKLPEPYAQYRSNIEKAVFATENTTESRSSITNTFLDDVEKLNPYKYKNRRRRRGWVRRTMCHIYTRQRRQDGGKCRCVCGICSVKNKIENETNLTDCASNLT